MNPWVFWWGTGSASQSFLGRQYVLAGLLEVESFKRTVARLEDTPDELPAEPPPGDETRGG